MQKVQIGFWSDGTAYNPFQLLLYSEKDAFDCSTTSLSNPFSIPTEIKVVHLHWIDSLKYFYGRSFFQVELFSLLGIYRLFREIGPKRLAVATIHNLRIHDDLGRRFQNRRFMKRIIKKFDLVHFLSQEAFEAFTVFVDYRLSIDKVYIGKHPNYSSAYIETNPISDLRGSLNIPLESIVIGYVGMIKPYKNLIMLLDAYLLLKRENSNLYLLIAGSNFDKDFDEKISKLAITDSNIKYIPRYVADSEIASYVKMLDVAVFPFDDPDEILNSGSLILSLSFCVQSVIPNFVSLSSFSRLSSVTTFEYGVLGSLVYSIQFKIDNYRNRKVVDGKFLSPDMSDWLDETSAKRVSQDFFHHVLLVLRKREIFKVGDSSE